eukprot:m.37724 g.37724  ORF g.37724 m.37724 type:complete len:335 (+) comp11129_c0_seq1:205-1209(+)
MAMATVALPLAADSAPQPQSSASPPDTRGTLSASDLKAMPRHIVVYAGRGAPGLELVTCTVEDELGAPTLSGVFVSAVAKNSVAASLGFCRGLQILKVNNLPCVSHHTVSAALRECVRDQTLAVQYNPKDFAIIDQGNELQTACKQVFDFALRDCPDESFQLKYLGYKNLDGSSDEHIQHGYRALKKKAMKTGVVLGIGKTGAVSCTSSRSGDNVVSDLHLLNVVQCRCSGAVVAMVMMTERKDFECHFFTAGLKAARAAFTAIMTRVGKGFAATKRHTHAESMLLDANTAVVADSKNHDTSGMVADAQFFAGLLSKQGSVNLEGPTPDQVSDC